jgi:hypothetical protein
VLVKKKVIRHEKLNLKYRELDETGAEDFLKNSYKRDSDTVILFHI